MNNELMYQTTMHVARELHKKGLLSTDEYKDLEAVFTEKYKPTLGVLISSLSLDYQGKQSDV